MVVYLFPADPLGGRSWSVDSHFAAEHAVADGIASTALLDSYSFGGQLRIRIPDGTQGPVIYRGWMLSAEEYGELESELTHRGYQMLTDQASYLQTHSIEGWYERFEGSTPATAIIDPGCEGDEAFARASSVVSGEGLLFFKGVAKSDPELSKAFGIQEVSEALDSLTASFGEDEKIAVRGFVDLDPEVAELRSWWVAGELFWVSRHPNFTGAERIDPLGVSELRGSAEVFLGTLRGPIGELESGFLTADIALTAEGRWILIELGDGQVSGVARDLSSEELRDFYSRLDGELHSL